MPIFKSLEEVILTGKTAVTIGNFDGLHMGHQKLIEKTKEISKTKNIQSVMLTFSNHPITYLFNKKVEIIMSNQKKYDLAQEMGIENIVAIPFDMDIYNMSAEEFVKNVLVSKLKVEDVIVGHDSRIGKDRTGDVDTLRELGDKYGFGVHVIEPVMMDNMRISSSYIRTLLQHGEVDKASKFMTRPHMVRGLVVHGKKLGRTLGFPTVNIKPLDHIVLPLTGVYFTKILVGEKLYYGATNVGNNPTIKDKPFSVETHILDFDREIYDEEVTVYFLERIRDELKFSSVEMLKKQMTLDIKKIRSKVFTSEGTCDTIETLKK